MSTIKMAKVFNIMPKWRDFSKFGHTVDVIIVHLKILYKNKPKFHLSLFRSQDTKTKQKNT